MDSLFSPSSDNPSSKLFPIISISIPSAGTRRCMAQSMHNPHAHPWPTSVAQVAQLPVLLLGAIGVASATLLTSGRILILSTFLLVVVQAKNRHKTPGRVLSEIPLDHRKGGDVYWLAYVVRVDSQYNDIPSPGRRKTPIAG